MKPSLSIETMFTASATAFDAVALYNNGKIIIRNNDEILHELDVVCEHLSISPNSKYVAYGEGDSVTVHELATNTTTVHTAEWPYKVHDNGALLHKAQALIELPKHYTFTPKGFVIANDRQLQLDQEIVDVAHTVVGTFRNFYVSASGLLLTYSGVELQNTRLNITHTFDFGRYVGLLSGTQLYLVDDKAKNFRIDVTSEINAPLLKKYLLPIDTGPNGEGSYHIDGKGVGTPTQIGDFFIHQDAVAKKLYVGGPRIKKNKIMERFVGSQFLGELSASEFISAASLMQEIGISWTRNTEASWLKFYDKVDGKIKYIARRPITNSISWNTMNSAGIVFGKEITIRGNRYIVRLIKGANSDPFDASGTGYDPVGSHGSEWNRLMYHVSVGNGNNYTSEPNAPGDWARYSNSALGNSNYTACQERNGNYALLRGYVNTVSHYTWGNVSDGRGWRPLLELVGSEMPSHFLGEIDATDFISGSALATALGVTEGIDSSSGKWLRYYDGNVHKIKLIAKQPIREQVSWSHLNSKNAVAGTPIVIDGMTYTVRLPKGATSNPSDAATGYDHENAYGSEWNHLMYRVAVGNENDIFDSEPLQKQARFTDIDLGITGQYSLCQEVALSEEAVNQIVVRGSRGVSYLSHAGREELLSWRPVLEIDADDYHDIHPVRKFVEQFETINGVPTSSWTPYKNSLMYEAEATGFVEFDAQPEIPEFDAQPEIMYGITRIDLTETTRPPSGRGSALALYGSDLYFTDIVNNSVRLRSLRFSTGTALSNTVTTVPAAQRNSFSFFITNGGVPYYTVDLNSNSYNPRFYFRYVPSVGAASASPGTNWNTNNTNSAAICIKSANRYYTVSLSGAIHTSATINGARTQLYSGAGGFYFASNISENGVGDGLVVVGYGTNRPTANNLIIRVFSTRSNQILIIPTNGFPNHNSTCAHIIGSLFNIAGYYVRITQNGTGAISYSILDVPSAYIQIAGDFLYTTGSNGIRAYNIRVSSIGIDNNTTEASKFTELFDRVALAKADNENWVTVPMEDLNLKSINTRSLITNGNKFYIHGDQLDAAGSSVVSVTLWTKEFGIGPQALIAGNMDLGFFGEVSQAELNRTSSYNPHPARGSRNVNFTTYLKFAHQGKIIYIGKTPLFSNLTHAQAIISVEQDVLLAGLSADQGGLQARRTFYKTEYLGLMQAVCNGTFASYTNIELGSAIGAFTITQEFSGANLFAHFFSAGNVSVTGVTPTHPNSLRAYRPVYEYDPNQQ